MPLDRIVDAAVELVDEKGADALSLRAVAQRLGSSTATLYRHLDSRTELVGLVLDRVLGEAVVDEASLAGVGWEDASRILAVAMFDALVRHRRSVSLLSEQIPTGPNTMAIREISVSMLLGHGFPPETAARFSVTLARYVLGFALQVREDESTSTPSERFEAPDPVRYPGLTAVAPHLPTPLDEEFRFGLDLLVLGLSHRT
jgi:AcrR family transcriptional regulator